MSRQCKILSAALHGVEAIPVTVEVSVTPGMTGMIIVGLADSAVQEARVRVKSAIRSSGFHVPTDNVVINLAPGDVKKTGSGFDLPIAIGVLVATGQIPLSMVEHTMFVGELSLEGEVRENPGNLAIGMCAKKLGCKLASATNYVLPIKGLDQIEISNLRMLYEPDAMLPIDSSKTLLNMNDLEHLDFSDVAGHDVAKRALQIATAGELGILMSGPPGSGKTLLASRVPSILPKLSENEKLESAVIHSVAGEPINLIVNGIRPFRNPHHSASSAGMLGGGTPVSPGEVTLAHNGVLFLDELAEFKPCVLQGLRQPIESGEVLITRAQGSLRLPASFMLIAATNPCPCGYYGDEARECQCSHLQITKYQGRVGGPLIDRFQMQIDVKRLPPEEVLHAGNGKSSSELREGVLKAREFAAWRRNKTNNLSEDELITNVSIHEKIVKSRSTKSTAAILKECSLGQDAEDYLTSFAEAENLSGRSIVGLLRVARTIADIEQNPKVEIDHLAEAMGFRLSKTFGGS